ncbi:MAG: transglutaminase domain-containing protein, partial [Bacteroidota bacterium]
RAIYIWITHNISYDVAQLDDRNKRRFKSNQESINYTLRSKRAICSGYSALFHEMATHAGVEVFTISGYKRYPDGYASNLSHAWNGVHLKSGEWRLLDATWDAGHTTFDANNKKKFVRHFDDEYFLAEPKVFIRDHVPFDPIWQFLMTPVSHESLKENDFSIFDFEGSYHFSDSITVSTLLPEKDRFLEEYRRISLFKGDVKVLNEHLDYLIKTIEVFRKNESVTHYNLAVKHLNQATSGFYVYRTYKSRKFRKPKVSKSKIIHILAEAYHDLIAAREAIEKVHTDDREFGRSVENLKDKITTNLDKVILEIDFVVDKFKLQDSKQQLLSDY